MTTKQPETLEELFAYLDELGAQINKLMDMRLTVLELIDVKVKQKELMLLKLKSLRSPASPNN